MIRRSVFLALALGCAGFLPPLPARAAPDDACAATAREAPRDSRIRKAIVEARREHARFGGQTVDRDGTMVRVGYHEGEWGRPAGEAEATWERVAAYWRSLSDVEPPTLHTSVGAVARQEVQRALAATAGSGTPVETAVRESLLRAAILDTPWSAAFISHLMKAAAFGPAEFAFSDSHVDYVQAAFAATAAEGQGGAAPHAFRACDVATTRPRAGDLLCATRASTSGTTGFAALASALAGRAPGQAFPMHCDLVVQADAGGDAKIETIGGNVFNSVTLARMTLNADRRLGAGYYVRAGQGRRCAAGAQPCRDHLSRRPWVVLLQFRH